jgi:DNA-binding NtrC family response regulator
MGEALRDLRWQVRETRGGAETLACLDALPAETVVLDSWLPDLEIQEFIAEFRRLHPETDLVMADASVGEEPGLQGQGSRSQGSRSQGSRSQGSQSSGPRSPRRNEILHALRRAQATDGAIWNTAPREGSEGESRLPVREVVSPVAGSRSISGLNSSAVVKGCGLPEFVGADRAMLEVSRRIRLVAARRSPVLIEGPTGSGKELVARALHRLSPRAGRKMVALNCAAIPESLLEAELFGHTRGAFTGAVQGRTGRIEAAHGGTLLLDEIGEMPLGLQAKLLRFLETGELQRVGENEPVKVDVRIVAATHRPLRKMAAEGTFRTDLYYRLAVFLIRTPALAGRADDIRAMAQRCLERLAMDEPAKRMTARAMELLVGYAWPGNVRELEHVVERAWILAEDRPEIDGDEIEFDEPG